MSRCSLTSCPCNTSTMRAHAQGWLGASTCSGPVVPLGASSGAVLGLMVGAMLGGNLFPQFEFAGVRGYEAVGDLGALIGAAAFGALGFLLARLALLKTKMRTAG